jgi:hypothetical protein
VAKIMRKSVFVLGIAALASAACLPAHAWGLDGPTLLKVLDGLHDPAEGYSCEYEGRVRYTRASDRDSLRLGNDGIAQIFSGSFTYRWDGAARLDYFVTHMSDHKVAKASIAIINDRKTIASGYVDDLMKTAKVSRADAHSNNIEHPYSLGRLHGLDLLRRHCAAQLTMVHEGTEPLDGYSCEVVTFKYTPASIPPEKESSQKFWVDLERGGHILRRELYRGANLSERLSRVQLAPFDGPKGSKVWLPISGTYEVFLYGDEKTRTILHSKDPIRIEEYLVMSPTVSLIAGIRDGHFAIELSPGTVVTDTVRGITYDFGRDQRPAPVTVAQAQERLRSHLSEADAQASELRAASWQRGGRTEWSWLPWAAAAAALIVAVIVFVKRRVAA